MLREGEGYDFYSLEQKKFKQDKFENISNTSDIENGVNEVHTGFKTAKKNRTCKLPEVSFVSVWKALNYVSAEELMLVSPIFYYNENLPNLQKRRDGEIRGELDSRENFSRVCHRHGREHK